MEDENVHKAAWVAHVIKVVITGLATFLNLLAISDWGSDLKITLERHLLFSLWGINFSYSSSSLAYVKKRIVPVKKNEGSQFLTILIQEGIIYPISILIKSYLKLPY